MAETLIGGVFALAMLVLLYRAKGHSDRAVAALQAFRRARNEVYARLGIPIPDDGDDGDAPSRAPGAGSEPHAVRGARDSGA